MPQKGGSHLPTSGDGRDNTVLRGGPAPCTGDGDSCAASPSISPPTPSQVPAAAFAAPAAPREQTVDPYPPLPSRLRSLARAATRQATAPSLAASRGPA